MVISHQIQTVAQELIWKWRRHTSDVKRRKKIFVVSLHIFGSTSTISNCFGERFRDDQYAFVSFLPAVLLLNLPHAHHL